MSLQTLNIQARDQQGAPYADAHVRLYALPSRTLTTTAVTDASGKASLLVPGSTTYEVRYFVDQAFRSSVSELVMAEEGVELELTIQTIAPGDALDPRFCRVYEQFTAPAKGVLGGEVSILPVDVVTGTPGALLVFAPHVAVVRRGYVEFDLYRGSRYVFTLPGVEGSAEATIPDAPRARLSDILFPYVSKIQTAETSYQLHVGETLEIPVTLERSDRAIPSPEQLAHLWVFDSSVVQVGTFADRIVVTGVAPGVSELRFLYSRVGAPVFPVVPSIHRLQYPEPQGLPITLEVLP